MSNAVTLDPALTDHPVGMERRASVRHACSWGMSCQELPDGGALVAARVRDLSHDGIGFVAPQPFPEGAEVGIDLHNDEADLWYTLMARVVRSAPLGERDWLIGCQFARRLSDVEIEYLL